MQMTLHEGPLHGATIGREFTSCMLLIINYNVLISCSLRDQAKDVFRQVVLDAYLIVTPNIKWVPHMICGVSLPEGLVLQQGHIISLCHQNVLGNCFLCVDF